MWPLCFFFFSIPCAVLVEAEFVVIELSSVRLELPSSSLWLPICYLHKITVGYRSHPKCHKFVLLDALYVIVAGNSNPFIDHSGCQVY